MEPNEPTIYEMEQENAKAKKQNGRPDQDQKEHAESPLAYRLDRVLEQRFNKIMGGQFKWIIDQQCFYEFAPDTGHWNLVPMEQLERIFDDLAIEIIDDASDTAQKRYRNQRPYATVTSAISTTKSRCY